MFKYRLTCHLISYNNVTIICFFQLYLHMFQLEQVSTFAYLGCGLTYDMNVDVSKKINTFQSVCGTIKCSLKIYKLLKF